MKAIRIVCGSEHRSCQPLFPLPDDLSFEQGAAFTLQGLTAHYLIYEYRLPKRSDTVLIHAAAGGMGLLLAQWAKHLGANSGGGLNNFMRTREELLRRAGDVIRGIREGWLRLNIDWVFPLEEAAEARRRLESRESIGKICFGHALGDSLHNAQG